MLNIRFTTPLLLLLLSKMGASQQLGEEPIEDTCAPIEDLGTPSLDRYNYETFLVSNESSFACPMYSFIRETHRRLLCLFFISIILS